MKEINYKDRLELLCKKVERHNKEYERRCKWYGETVYRDTLHYVFRLRRIIGMLLNASDEDFKLMVRTWENNPDAFDQAVPISRMRALEKYNETEK